MKTTKTLLGNKAREAIYKGVNAIFIPTALTLGPEGKNALLYRTFNRGSRIINDGVTVADCQEPKDPFVNLAANAFKEGCKRTNQRVGDGTTATTCIGGKLFNDLYNQLSEGKSEFVQKNTIGVMTLKRQILESAEKVKEQITKSAKKIETLQELENIATVSIENREIGKIVAKMAWEVGVDGFIDVVEGYKGEIETEVIKGFRFPAKVSARAFVNKPERYEMEAVDCPVFITNYALDNANEFGQTFQKLNASTSKIIVIAPSFSENVLVNMVNATKAGYFFFPVKAPSLRTEQFEDLAIYCGAKFIDKNKGHRLQNVSLQDLGFIGKLIVKDTENKEDAIATGGRGEKEEVMSFATEEEVAGKKKKVFKEKTSSQIAERIAILKGQLAETRQEQFKKLLERRIASMSSAVGVIRVGDSTEAESLYQKLKIEDGVYACKAALRGGYVKGGGLCLKEIADKMKDDDPLKTAIAYPYELIQASVDGGIAIGKDIIDPTEAMYYAVEHAVGVVANLITVEIITPEIPDPIHGDGEYAIARALNEFVISNKIHLGQLTENQREMEMDRQAGYDSIVDNDNG